MKEEKDEDEDDEEEEEEEDEEKEGKEDEIITEEIVCLDSSLSTLDLLVDHVYLRRANDRLSATTYQCGHEQPSRE